MSEALTADRPLTNIDFADGSGPVPARQHPNGGGWVALTAHVDPSCRVEEGAFVGGQARVEGRVTLEAGVRLIGLARATGAVKMSGPVLVADSARVEDFAEIRGSGEGVTITGLGAVRDRARVEGEASVHAAATIMGSAVISDRAMVSGNAVIGGLSRLSGEALATDNAQLHGADHIAGSERIAGPTTSGLYRGTEGVAEAHKALGEDLRYWAKVETHRNDNLLNPADHEIATQEAKAIGEAIYRNPAWIAISRDAMSGLVPTMEPHEAADLNDALRGVRPNAWHPTEATMAIAALTTGVPSLLPEDHPRIRASDNNARARQALLEAHRDFHQSAGDPVGTYGALWASVYAVSLLAENAGNNQRDPAIAPLEQASVLQIRQITQALRHASKQPGGEFLTSPPHSTLLEAGTAFGQGRAHPSDIGRHLEPTAVHAIGGHAGGDLAFTLMPRPDTPPMLVRNPILGRAPIEADWRRKAVQTAAAAVYAGRTTNGQDPIAVAARQAAERRGDPRAIEAVDLIMAQTAGAPASQRATAQQAATMTSIALGATPEGASALAAAHSQAGNGSMAARLRQAMAAGQQARPHALAATRSSLRATLGSATIRAVTHARKRIFQAVNRTLTNVAGRLGLHTKRVQQPTAPITANTGPSTTSLRPIPRPSSAAPRAQHPARPAPPPRRPALPGAAR